MNVTDNVAATQSNCSHVIYVCFVIIYFGCAAIALIFSLRYLHTNPVFFRANYSFVVSFQVYVAQTVLTLCEYLEKNAMAQSGMTKSGYVFD